MSTTVSGRTAGFLKPMTKVSSRMPSTSSMIAALRMVVPTLPLSLPISRRVSTVMLTEVAVMMVPMNTASKKASEPTGLKPYRQE